jgi:hypothetical protein
MTIIVLLRTSKRGPILWEKYRKSLSSVSARVAWPRVYRPSKLVFLILSWKRENAYSRGLSIPTRRENGRTQFRKSRTVYRHYHTGHRRRKRRCRYRSGTRETKDYSPVYWGHIEKRFQINKNIARDLGEEILLEGQIRILQGAVPKIGKVDEEGIDRLYIRQSPGVGARDDVFIYQGMSFPMKNVIAGIGSHGPSAIFSKIDIQQITCSGNISRIAKEGEQLLLLKQNLMSSKKGLYAIDGPISPSCMEIQAEGTIEERKHSTLIFTATKDAVLAVESIRESV